MTESEAKIEDVTQEKKEDDKAEDMPELENQGTPPLSPLTLIS